MSFPTPTPGPPPPGIRQPMRLRGGQFMALPNGSIVPVPATTPPAPAPFATPPVAADPALQRTMSQAQLATAQSAAPMPPTPGVPPGIAPPGTPLASEIDRAGMAFPRGAALSKLGLSGAGAQSPFGQSLLEEAQALPTVFQMAAGGLQEPGGLASDPAEYDAFMQGYLDAMRNPSPESSAQINQLREVVKAQVQAAHTLPGSPIYETAAQAIQQDGPDAYWELFVKPALVARGVLPRHLRNKEREFGQLKQAYEKAAYVAAQRGQPSPTFQEFLAQVGYQGVDV